MELVCNSERIFRIFEQEKSLEMIKKAGFTAVDNSLTCMEKPGNPFAGDDWQEVAQKYRKNAENAGLKIVQTHTPFNFKNWGDPEQFENVILPAIKRSIAVSGIFGAKVAVVHPLHYLPYHTNEEKIFEMNMNFYRDLIPLCETYNIKIGVENMWQRDPRRKHIVFDVCGKKEEFVRYIDTLNSPQIVATLDVGHVGLPLGDDEAWDVVRALGHDRLQSLHIHDNDYMGDLHTLPYHGKMDWAQICRALGEIDYQGDFTYEVGFVTPTMDDYMAQLTLKYMADTGKHLMELIDNSRP